MKLKAEMHMVDLGDELFGVPLVGVREPDYGILRMNRDALDIIEMLASDTTVDKIIAALAVKYENDRDELTRFVNKVVDYLWNVGMLEE